MAAFMECQAGDFLLFDPATCSRVLGGIFSSPPSASLSHSSMQSSPIHRPGLSGCPYARLTDFPRHDHSPTTQVASLAADWQPCSSFCPTVGTTICLALCLRHSGTVIEPEESAACGFVSWSNAAYHVPMAPCPSCRGFSERQRWPSLGNTSQNAARRVSVCYMHDEQVGYGLALTELNISAIRANRKEYARNGVT